MNNITIFAPEIVGSSYPMTRKFPSLSSPSSTNLGVTKVTVKQLTTWLQI